MSNRAAMLLVMFAALAVRAVYLTTDVDVPAQDTPDYDEIALNLVAGEGFVAHDNWYGHPMKSWRPPLYPALLAGVYGSFGYHHVLVQMLQAFLGALTAVGVLCLGRRLHPPSALAVGLIVALYPPLVAGTAEIMTETLFASLLVAATLVGLSVEARSGWIGSGALVGLATLTRPVGLLLAPALMLARVWSAWQRRDGRAWLGAIRRCGWISAGVLLVLSPWTIRNATVHGAFVPVSTHGGFILAGSNADEPEWRKQDGWQISPDVLVDTPNEIDRDRAWRAQGWSWIAAHPVPWLRLAGERFLRFWYVFRPDYNIGFMLWLPLILAGVIRFGTHPGYREITSFAGVSLLVFSTLLYGSTRFRLPMEPLFLLYAGPVLHEIWSSRQRLRWAAGGTLWAGLNLLIWWQDEAIHGLVLNVLQVSGLK